ncbi:MAG: transposase [Anaerolineae bacterium]|nr:transposase [Anaerolineae bacterium]
MKDKYLAERKLAVMQLRQGKTVTEVAQSLSRHPNWVRKWQKRFETEGWSGLKERTRAPKKPKHQLLPEVRAAICQTRLELEAEAALGEGLKYIGGRAVRTRLKQKRVKPLPSVSSIERTLREAGLTRPKAISSKSEIAYPRLQPTQPHQLCQVDIVPHFLQGGQRVACFNALDVVSRYPTGKPFARRRSQDAAGFLVHVWEEMGIARYTQVDNEACFSGGATHPYVLGKVVRLALAVGTELVFSPVRHPESNGFVERFHQDYDRHVWEDTYLSDLADVDKQAVCFFGLYRQRQDHKRLQGKSPGELHGLSTPRKLALDFTLPSEKQPLRVGRVHFIRRVQPDRSVRVLNVNWLVPHREPDQGVWVTLEFQVSGATLSIFDAAPDATDRICLVVYPFPLNEPVVPPPQKSVHLEKQPTPVEASQPKLPAAWPPLSPVQRPTLVSSSQRLVQVGERLFLSTVYHTARLTRRVFHTMF